MRRSASLTLCLVLAFLFLISPNLQAQSQTSQAPSDEAKELQKQLNEMRTLMDKIQARLDRIEGAQAEAPSTPPTTMPTPPATTVRAAPPVSQEGAIQTAPVPLPAPASSHIGEATATFQQFAEDPEAAPRFNNAPLDPKYHGYFPLPGTQTLLKIGGYFKTDFIYDLKPAGNVDAFVPSSFPFPEVGSVDNANVSIRPTRLSLDFRVPTSRMGDVRFYLEGDLFGTNATTPRLRHAYGQAKNFLIGQTFSNFMDPDAIPDTLDFEGPNGIVNVKNPQFRYGVQLTHSSLFYFSVEKPTSDLIFETSQFMAQPNAPSPDGTARFRQTFERGHFQVAAVFRSIAAFLPNGKTDSVFGWGLNDSLSLRTFGKDNLILGAAAGRGISRYIQGTSGLGIDAEPVTGRTTAYLQATPAAGLDVAYQHYWRTIKTLRSNAVYSYAAVNNTALAAPTTYNHASYAGTNLIFNPFGSLNIGAEFLYGWTMLQNGEKANAPRIMLSAKYSFVKLDRDKP